MHRCLYIQEIVRNVASYSADQDVLPMALTCRTFHEPAMDFVWKELTGLGPLIRCLPEKLWTVELDEDNMDLAWIVVRPSLR